MIYERRFSPKISASVAALLGIPHVVEINGIPEEEAAMQDRPPGSGAGARLKKRARYQLLRRASAAIVAVTEGLRTRVTAECGVSPARTYVVPNGVDPDLFRPQDQAEARRAMSLPSEPTVCFVGNLVRWQDLACSSRPWGYPARRSI